MEKDNPSGTSSSGIPPGSVKDRIVQDQAAKNLKIKLDQDTAEKAGKEPCPVCGKSFASVRHHINYMGAKDPAHKQYKETGKVSTASPEYFSSGAGDAMVGMLLSIALTRRPDMLVPEDWRKRAGDVHQKILEKHIGPKLEEKSDIVALVFVWGELITVNAAADAMKEAASPRAPESGKEEVKNKTSTQPSPYSDPHVPTVQPSSPGPSGADPSSGLGI